MLKRITVGILVIMMILAVGCANNAKSVEKEDGVLPDGVHVDFKVVADDEGLSRPARWLSMQNEAAVRMRSLSGSA